MMKTKLMAAAALALATAAPLAQAHEVAYNVVTTWFEDATQPKNTVFEGSFLFNEDTLTVTGLSGRLSEAMTGTSVATMSWVNLSNQLSSQHDSVLGGTLVAVFAKNTTATFLGNTWAPADGINAGGIFAGGPATKNYASSIQNSYALIFVPDAPTLALSTAQIKALAYADCAPGGMMGAACMTGTDFDSYGGFGTMGGFPLSQTITAAPVPEPGTWALMLGGLAGVGALVRKRKPQA